MAAPTARQLKDAAALLRRKGRQATGCFQVEGWRSVMSAIDAGAVIEHIFVGPALTVPDDDMVRLADAAPVFRIREREMQQLSDVTTPPGILAVVRQPEPAARDPWPERVLLLDGVQDPGNVGTLIRTAAWMGIDTVAIGPGTADPFAPKVVRSTMGGLWDVVLDRVADLTDWLEQATTGGAQIWITDMTGTSLTDWAPSTPSVLVIGSEAQGCSEAVRRAAAGAVSIGRGGVPGAVESLNAAVAGAIIMSRWAPPVSQPPV